mmetsp:Transcript_5553/g.13078  ORF Transcript_5553/g.13078 Transcript_5553/m.13078 type:complete len:388 (-) Transcript_5553:116-1279(-)
MPSRQRSRRQRGYRAASEVRGRASERSSEPSIPHYCLEQDRVDSLLSSLRDEAVGSSYEDYFNSMYRSSASAEIAERTEELRERDRTLARLAPLRGYSELSERSTPSASTNNTPRPLRSTTRKAPVCHFFAMNGSCRNGDNCAFSHDVLPGDTRSVVCSFFRKGSCRYGDSCRFSHDLSVLEEEEPAATAACQPCSNANNSTPTTQDEDEADLICGICMDHPTKFGLLSGCDHVFCFECLMEWRSSSSSDDDEQNKSLVKVCPICRTHSDYVLSSYIYAKTGNGKEDLMAAHKLRLSQIPCKRFNGELGSCPFGRDCFYQHIDKYGENVKHMDQSMQDIQEELERRRQRRLQHLESQRNIDAELEILEAQLALLQLGLASFAFQLDI